jgi:hypothetical protein
LAAFLSVLSSLVAGIVLLVAPWTSWWDSNYFVGPHPTLRVFVLSAFTRGSVSGLGLVNIILAFHEARAHLAESGDRL